MIQHFIDSETHWQAFVRCPVCGKGIIHEVPKSAFSRSEYLNWYATINIRRPCPECGWMVDFKPIGIDPAPELNPPASNSPTSPEPKRAGASNPKNGNAGPQKNPPKNSREAG